MSGKQKQSSKAKQSRQRKKEGLLEIAQLSVQPPFNILQNFFLDFVTRENRKCLKKQGIHLLIRNVIISAS